MANPVIYYSNPTSWTISTSLGVDPSNPTTNLLDFIRNTKWMSGYAVSGQTIKITLPAAQECDYMIFDNHNMEGWTIRIDAADDTGFTTGVEVAASIAMPASPSVIAFGGAPITKRYWRVKLGDDGVAPAAPYIGNMFLGKRMIFTFPHDFGGKVADSSFISTVGRSLSGIKRVSQAVGGTRLIEVTFSLISDAAATAFRTFHDTVRGQLRPFYYSPDGGTTLYYVSLAKDYNPITQYRPGQNNTQTIVMETADSEVV